MENRVKSSNAEDEQYIIREKEFGQVFWCSDVLQYVYLILVLNTKGLENLLQIKHP